MIGADLFHRGREPHACLGSLRATFSVAVVAAVLFVRALGSTLHTPAFNALTLLHRPARGARQAGGHAAVHAVG